MKYLIADDDPVSLLALSYLVADIPNTTVLHAEDGDSAWQALETMNEPVISLLDNRMPGMNGVDVLKKMRHSSRYIGWPVMIITSTADRSLVSDAVQLGVNGFVMKPVGQDSLLRIVDLAIQFENSILEPFSDTAARLDVSQNKVQTCVYALINQLDLLVVALQSATSENLPLIKQRADTCRSAALMLGSKHLDMIFEKLLLNLDGDQSVHSYTSFVEAILLTRNEMEQRTEAQ